MLMCLFFLFKIKYKKNQKNYCWYDFLLSFFFVWLAFCTNNFLWESNICILKLGRNSQVIDSSFIGAPFILPCVTYKQKV